MFLVEVFDQYKKWNYLKRKMTQAKGVHKLVKSILASRRGWWFEDNVTQKASHYISLREREGKAEFN